MPRPPKSFRWIARLPNEVWRLKASQQGWLPNRAPAYGATGLVLSGIDRKRAQGISASKTMNDLKTIPTSCLSRRLRVAACVVLVIGLVAALCVYLGAFDASETEALSYTIQGGQIFAGDDSHEMRELERMGGKASVMTFRFEQWFASLWHGARLASTLTVLSILIAGLIFYIAGLMDESIEN